jgi:hypothetical protein
MHRSIASRATSPCSGPSAALNRTRRPNVYETHSRLPRPELIRNPALAAELQSALERGKYDTLFALLCRLSGLPGPRANEPLARAFAAEVARAGPHADKLLRALCAMGPTRAPAGTDGEFLAMVGAACLGARLAHRPDAALMEQLRALADDPRHRVRESVGRALVDASSVRGDELAHLLSAWSDGYLGATVALEAVTARVWLDRSKSAEAALGRLEEAFALAERASRADQRSQGYRTLVKALAEAPARLLDRFPRETLAWLESKAGTPDVALRAALSELLRKARSRGHGASSLEKFEQVLADSAPPRRDPRTYVGPTRKRGARRR